MNGWSNFRAFYLIQDNILLILKNTFYGSALSPGFYPIASKSWLMLQGCGTGTKIIPCFSFHKQLIHPELNHPANPPKINGWPMKVQILINALSSEHGVIREAAARALGSIGPEAKAAVPALVGALKDGDPAVFFESEEALIKIGPKAVPALAETLENKNEDKFFRRRAAEILGKIGLEAVPALIKALKDADSDVRWVVAYTLADIAPEAKTAAVISLMEMLKDDRKWVCEYAVWVLKTMKTPEARKALEEYQKISE